MNKVVSYVVVLDGDLTLLPYFIKHQRALGVDTFYCINYGSQATMHIMRETIGPGFHQVGTFQSESFSTTHREGVLNDLHEEGVIGLTLDLDEFPSMQLKVLLDRWREGLINPPFIGGNWVYRAAPLGEFIEIDASRTLNEQFPCEVAGRYLIPGKQQLRKRVAAIDIKLTGLHPAAGPACADLYDEPLWIDVYHFRYRTGAVQRYQRRKQLAEPDSRRAQLSQEWIELLTKYPRVPEGWLVPAREPLYV